VFRLIDARDPYNQLVFHAVNYLFEILDEKILCKFANNYFGN